jgi:NhaP-type Na+/H+ or K+/H+ antiporter
MLAPLHLLAETAAQEGAKTVEMMLAVGGVFIGVIALGQLSHWLRHRSK